MSGGRVMAADAQQAPTLDEFAEPVSVLLSEADEPVPWIVEGVFAEGAHGWIGAEPKVGKSWLGLDLALCAALGIPFLGYDVPHAVRVLYVQEEDSRRRVRRRLRKLLHGHGYEYEGWPAALNVNLRDAIRKGFRIDDPATRKWLAREMASFRPDLVIVDVFNEVHGAKEKDQDAISPVLRHFTELERAHGGAFIILHHFYKGDGRTPRGRGGQSLRGSSALHGWAENSLYLFYVGKNRFRVEPESKDESDAEQFEVEITDTPNGGVQLVRHELAQQQNADARHWCELTMALTATPNREITASEAGKVMKCDKSTARTRLRAWEKQGRLVSRHADHGGRNGTDYFQRPPTPDPFAADDTPEGASVVPAPPPPTTGGALHHVENHHPQRVGGVEQQPLGCSTLPPPTATAQPHPPAKVIALRPATGDAADGDDR